MGLMYWWRLEHGAETPLLNHAYNTMKSENHIWLQNIYYFLVSIGLGHVWTNIGSLDKEALKNIVTTHMENMFIQKYDAYVKSNVYKKQSYLSKIESPEIRSTFSKLRLDVNATLDCKYRSFRFKNVPDKNCQSCNSLQSVTHLLLHCQHQTI